MTEEEKELYARQLAREQAAHPKVQIILDATPEDADWLKVMRREREEKK